MAAEIGIARLACQIEKVTRLLPDSAPGTRHKNGAYGIRTRDLLNAIEALYQLS
jgi:hypothetical protein